MMSSKIKQIQKKTIVFLLGVFFVLVLLEAALRLIAIDSWLSSPIKNKDSNAYTIMSLGNSFTYGSGAPNGMDYPTQLERILNSTRDRKYSVINRGLRNINTSFIVESLPKWLEEDRPNLVFIMTGEPNYWNRYGYWNFLQKNKQEEKATILERNDFLRFFKTFKLIELFLNRSESQADSYSKNHSNTFKGVLKNNDPELKLYLGYLWIGSLEGADHFDFYTLTEEQAKEAIEMLNYVWEKDKNPVASRLMAEYYFINSPYSNQGFHYLEQAINAQENFCFPCWVDIESFNLNASVFSPEKVLALKQLLETKKDKLKFKNLDEFFLFIDSDKASPEERTKYLHQMNKIYPSSMKVFNILFNERMTSPRKLTLESLQRSIDTNPFAATGDLPKKLFWLRNENPELKEEIDLLFKKTATKFPNVNLDKLEHMDNLIAKWVLTDLEKMISLIQQSGAKIVIQNYPPVKSGPPRLVDNVLRKWWKERKDKKNIEFLDVGLALKQKLDLKNGGDFYYATQLGPTDNHLNENGYREIAELMLPFVP